MTLGEAMQAEKRPRGKGWKRRETPVSIRHLGGSISCWSTGPIVVISHLADMDYPSGVGKGPTFFITVSANGVARPTNAMVRKAKSSFQMTEAEEDNHLPGVARGFFLVVDPAERVPCPCKDEELVREADGFIWSKRKYGPCERCTVARIHGGACQEHGAPQ